MEAFTRHEGIAAPLLRDNIDTDTVVPIIRLVGLDLSELGHWLFESIRYRPDGSENPEFVLNRAPYRNASVLLAGPNFGCGSSREGAVTALAQFGFRCVIAPSFGEIFYNNCFKNGLLPVELAQEKVEALASQVASAPAEARVVVDLENCAITAPDGSTVPFAVDEARRENMLRGLDDIGLTLQYEEDIAAFQARDREERPWIYDWAAE